MVTVSLSISLLLSRKKYLTTALRARDARLDPSGVVIGGSASGASAYIVAVIGEACQRGAMAIDVASRPDAPE
jgi:N-acetylmuramic acid 6-phosphate (MurNAc-6-P) etherase